MPGPSGILYGTLGEYQKRRGCGETSEQISGFLCCGCGEGETSGRIGQPGIARSLQTRSVSVLSFIILLDLDCLADTLMFGQTHLRALPQILQGMYCIQIPHSCSPHLSKHQLSLTGRPDTDQDLPSYVKHQVEMSSSLLHGLGAAQVFALLCVLLQPPRRLLLPSASMARRPPFSNIT